MISKKDVANFLKETATIVEITPRYIKWAKPFVRQNFYWLKRNMLSEFRACKYLVDHIDELDKISFHNIGLIGRTIPKPEIKVKEIGKI